MTSIRTPAISINNWRLLTSDYSIDTQSQPVLVSPSRSMRFSCLSLSLLLASCHQVSAIQSPVSVLDVPRGGAIVEPEQLILLKKVGFAATGVLAPAVNVFQDVYKTEPLPEGTLKGYCAESFCWSLLGVALLMHYATKMTVGTDRALGLSALPTLYFYYKETLKGTYGKLGYSKGTGPAIAAVVALCVGSILTKYGLDADLASKILIGLTVVSCGISSFAPEKGASLKGVSLGAGKFMISRKRSILHVSDGFVVL